MTKIPKPKLLAAVLTGGTVFLVGGTAYAASLPSHGVFWRPGVVPAAAMPQAGSPAATPTQNAQSASPSVLPSRPAPTAVTPSTPAAIPPVSASSQRPAAASVTYTVKSGDTLSGIAEWFRLHGYGDLYQDNKTVIGSNPNIIRPGQRITLHNDGLMTVAPAG